LPTRNSYTEQELVSLLKAKDAEGFNYLYQQYSPQLYGIIIRIINDREYANDILQEAFLTIWCKIDLYDATKSKLITWMSRVTRNHSIDVRKSKTYLNNTNNQSIEPLISNESVMVDYTMPTELQIIDKIALAQMLRQLKPEYYSLVYLKYLKGYTQHQIAQIKGMPIGTVKSKMRTALLQLKEYALMSINYPVYGLPGTPQPHIGMGS